MFRFLTVTASISTALVAVGCTKAGNDGKINELSERIDKLEASQKQFGEMKAFLEPIMAQQKAQAAQKAASEPDPNAVFAINIAGNAFAGPAGAPITIVEAFDFD